MTSHNTVSYGARRRFTGRLNRVVKKVRKIAGKKRMRPGFGAAVLHPRHKMRRGGSVSSVKGKSYRDPNQYRQMEVLSRRMGKRDRSATFMRKLIRSSYNYTKYVCRAYNRDGDGGPAGEGLRQPMGFETVGSLNYLPVLVFDLTEIPQATASSARYQHSSWRMTQDSTTGAVGFQALGTMDNFGAYTGIGWQEYVNLGSNAGANVSSTRRAVMEYINMRFRIRGPTQRPTRVTVQLVQPYAWFLGNPSELPLTSGSTVREHYQEWINLAARNTASPIQNIPSSIKRPWKVLRSMAYDIQPTSTTEGDVNGHDVVQKWFWRCNRSCAYDWQGYNNQDDADATNLSIGDATTPDTNVTNWLQLGKRVFLVVSAYAPNSKATFDPTVHPSFEYSFEKKLSSLTGQVMY